MHENEIRDMTEWPAGTVARLKVHTSPSSTSWPYAEKLPRGQGWQSGEIHYPESQVMSVEAVFEDVRASTVTTEAELNALPVGSVVRVREGFVIEKERGWVIHQNNTRTYRDRWVGANGRDITIPAQVLFRPV